MPEIGSAALNEVDAALERYTDVVEQSDRAPSTKKTHIDHARYFVRWLKGEFDPSSMQR